MLSNEQLLVVNSRIKSGYINIGIFNSTVNDCVTVGLIKGKHRVQINSLGYDEFSGNQSSFTIKNEG